MFCTIKNVSNTCGIKKKRSFYYILSIPRELLRSRNFRKSLFRLNGNPRTVSEHRLRKNTLPYFPQSFE